ncbi:baculoviral IAP repeat-containing protein 2-like [Ruditapes philippinarum]|uniref:baculoviral IAP repeat-containing protein 2-like n=1 Tax=Ruditapes philippinarum TaxID=129788 RepID=UPI00295A8969|nr:baculoviral IAP repeat-containing protein 2-like [Ruditapes philippinarum]
MDDNSDDDLIQFSHNESELKNGEQVSNVTTTKTRSYTAAMEMRADMPNVNTFVRPKVQTYDPNMSQQVSYPPTCRYPLRHRHASTLSANENQQSPRANSSVYHHQYSATSQSVTGALIQSSPPAITSRHQLTEKSNMIPGSEGQTHQRLNRRERRATGKPLRFHEYADYRKRVSSFEFWPIQIKQTREQMADAGFFYTGSDDLVQCFQCYRQVRRWENGDDVYAEHARIFPLCPYIREHRGDSFIAQTVNEDKEFSAKDQSLQYAQQDQQEFLKYFESKRNRLLEMGFNDDEFKIVRQHFKNIGNFKPDIDEIVDALTETKTCED